MSTAEKIQSSKMNFLNIYEIMLTDFQLGLFHKWKCYLVKTNL